MVPTTAGISERGRLRREVRAVVSLNCEAYELREEAAKYAGDRHARWIVILSALRGLCGKFELL